jgi:hypothetical protein
MAGVGFRRFCNDQPKQKRSAVMARGNMTTSSAIDARKKLEMLQEILSLCPKADVPIGEQLEAQGLATIDETGYIHVDKAKMAAALAARRQS